MRVRDEVHKKEIPRSDCALPALFESHLGCCPHKICPADHYPFFIRSGLANMVGPKICLNNTIIMGGLINNIGWGLNIVVVKGRTGEILERRYFNVFSGGLLEFLKLIQTGSIVLVASYDDPAVVLTDEIREIFARLGSTMIRSVKKRDTWVFAGSVGILKKSQFEKLTANDEKSNVYGDWPEMEEVGGCFPRKI
ncbi:protein FAM3C isoform X2 [Colossoma macropomum]|uniref:protein FAM3C isoform X2 n=1 Tax=Colossoma macropomum TaxID=42526 RepID=UPI00186554EC|nr:protein FAM3C isoform X2 [Colossoma macropomum]